MVTRRHDTDLDRLAGNILEELRVQNATRQLGLEDAVLVDLAERIAVNVDYAFECRWAPRWVKDGEAHRWSEQGPSGEHFYAECLSCGWISEPAATADAASRAFETHDRAEH